MQLIQYAPSTRDGAEAAAADRAALDQQVLRARPHAGKILHQVVRRPRPHRVRDLLGQSGRSARPRWASRTTCGSGRSPRSTRSSRRPARPRSMPSAIASAARCSRSRSPTWRSDERRAHRFGDAVHRAGRLHPRRRSQGVRRRASSSKRVEKRMAERGYLEGKKMANAFNMLRSNDLIWPYVINNYLRGKAPMPFDLLYWNSDATRMPAANHAFYLRHCYCENTLTQRQDGGRRRQARSRQGDGADLQPRHPRGPHRAGQIGVRRLKILRRPGEVSCSPAPAISPAWSTRRPRGSTSTGPAASPAAARSKPGSQRPRSTPARGGRTGSHGSRTQDGTTATARKPGGGKLKPIEDAPGSYVKVRD